MEQRRRIGAYGVLRDGDGRVLLVRGSADADHPGVWQLPGGGLAHAEPAEDAVVREFAEETGLAVRVTGLRDAVADVTRYPDLDVALHTDRIVFDVAATGGELADEPAGTTDLARWYTLDEVGKLPLLPFTADVLDLAVDPLPADALRPRREPFPPPATDRRQRFAAYGLVTDPAGRILLTMIADGYPGAGKWHLPGGGTDHGEQPAAGLLRELVEEAGQLGRVVGLLAVDNLHNPGALGPEGRPLDWHGVRVIYRVRVDVPTEAVVTELAGGSTARAAWFAPEQVSGLRTTDVVALATGQRGS
ncbi:NUDIX hydrolase [Micromonospora auratinigra]|uniref:ADP-ribose pyrophosphatase YjhB, NUDIX family n=1 Tax=Micromonospora auratinigra TaxID=261654 RepID=A0A1A8ZUD8_9ACTN|nr:NUDIX domain-containing protein [Micromonospora auratinigra]SBT47502.1 ADP-ribose pyrophosphatase YjhB, NUDIX family [Micromonospora auratinigra]